MRRRWWRYIACRCVPVFLAAVLSAQGAVQLKGSAETASWSFLLVYLVGTVVVGAIRARNGLQPTHSSPISLNVGGHSRSDGGYCLPNALLDAWLAPDISSLPSNIWATHLALALGKGLYDLMKARPERQTLRQAALRNINPELRDLVLNCGHSHARALEAILLTESLQRPPWARLVENHLPGSLMRGLFQMRSDGPLSDRDSVVRFVNQKMTADISGQGADSIDQIGIFRRHNPDEHFIEMCRLMYGDGI